MLTIITPTTGKDSLFHAIDSVKNQKTDVPIKHLILWDNKREGQFLYPDNSGITPCPYKVEKQSQGNYEINCISIKDNFVNKNAPGSSLRAVGLMVANSDYVTFMDDDVMWDSNHVENLLNAVNGKEWGFVRRRIWTILKTNSGGVEYECLGVDEFESVGEDAKTPYKMVDNNCMVFKREYGVSAACLYRKTEQYNDDRLMYNFLIEYGGEPGKSTNATVNQVCPEKLIEFFRKGCSKEE